MNGESAHDSYLTRIRNVELLPEELVTHLFSPSHGLTDEPPVDGNVLVVTNQRLMAFSSEDGRNETYLVPLESLHAVAVRSELRGLGSLLQGLLVVLCGLIVYLVVAYQLTGRFQGPTIPFIHMDVGAVAVLFAVLAGGWMVWKHYFSSENGTMSFQGSTWAFSFPCRSKTAKDQVYQLVNSVFSARGPRGLTQG